MSLRDLVPLAACFALACGRSSLATLPADTDVPALSTSGSSTSGSSTSGSSASGSSASGDVPCPDPADVVSLTAIRTGALFGRMLHVEGDIDGEHGYAIVDLSTAPARLVAVRPDLVGGAEWVSEVGPYHARLRGTAIDVIDASDAAAPVLVSTTELGSAPTDGFAGTLACDKHGLFVMLWSEAEQSHFLNRLDLADPAHPAAPVRLEPTPFATIGNRAEAQGSVWITWGSADVSFYDLTNATAIDSHGFATDGVHNYGALTRLKTDGFMAATTLENEGYALLYYAKGLSFVAYSSFGGQEKALLDVIGGEALVAIARSGGARAVVGFDVQKPPQALEKAPSSGMDVALEGSTGPLAGYRALTSDPVSMIVADGERLFDVPVGTTGSVEAITIVRKEAPPCL